MEDTKHNRVHPALVRFETIPSFDTDESAEGSPENVPVKVIDGTTSPMSNGSYGGGTSPVSAVNYNVDTQTLSLLEQTQIENGADERTRLHQRRRSGGAPEDGRETWTSGMDFLLSIIGFAVDLAAVWRFPYYAYKNGGGIFLIPYFTMLFIGAVPLLYLELIIGQYNRQGPVSVWPLLVPIFQGIGFCAILVSFYVSFYYNNILAWSFFYLFASLNTELPWSTCGNQTWVTPLCNDNDTVPHYGNASVRNLSRSPAQEYFENHVLGLHSESGFDNIGWPRWQLVLCLALTYLLLFLAMFKGVKSSGKVVWVTAIAPYVILLILFLRGIFLPGALTGIQFYMTFDFKRLLDAQLWIDAAVQVFYSTGAGFGVHLALSSYNQFHHNSQRDCLITVAANAAASLFSGFVVFTYLGYMANKQNLLIDHVAKAGPGLVFQVYPEAIATLPGAPLWSVLFFIMLLTLGMDSSMGGMEAILTGMLDYFHNFFRRFRYGREGFTAFVCGLSFLIGLINCTPAGIYTFQWFDTFSAGVSLLFVAFFEAIAVAWFYGMTQLQSDIQEMLGRPPGWFWRVCWKILTPVFLLVVIVLAAATFPALKYDNYIYPGWATPAGWVFSLSSTLLIPAVGVYKVARTPGTWRQKIALNISPARDQQEIIKKNYVKRFKRKHWFQI
ncbi:sodium-dependent dopamine transporter-like [Paramacrobiotus metropolitanus]|uniref:sodium-dependent dopamine transporter-like n=1 Tax=Paramacrobiotus metropolitanus TaxID=2943436 RepID=UPI00244648B5|nr:sodium-dependent dopamine transporter-like [Paramacrobiotus metropolitanus]